LEELGEEAVGEKLLLKKRWVTFLGLGQLGVEVASLGHKMERQGSPSRRAKLMSRMAV